jgi:hypothetical protein
LSTLNRKNLWCLYSAVLFVPPCILLIRGLWVKSCKHIEPGKGQQYPVFTSIVLFLMQKSQSAIIERKLGQIVHCSAHCGRPNYHQNYTRVLELGSARPRDAQFLVPVNNPVSWKIKRNHMRSENQKNVQNLGKISKKSA